MKRSRFGFDRLTIDGASYTLDNAGNRTAKTDQRTAVATSYGYDNIYQLLSATQGVSILAHTFHDPALIDLEAARLQKWIRSL